MRPAVGPETMLAFALGANRPLLAARQCAQLPAIATLEGRSGRSAWGRRLISHLYCSHYSSPPVTGISGRSAGLQRAQRRANGALRRSRGRGRHGAAAAPRTATRCGAAGAVTLAELRTPVTVAVAGCRPVNQRRFCLGTSALLAANLQSDRLCRSNSHYLHHLCKEDCSCSCAAAVDT